MLRDVDFSPRDSTVTGAGPEIEGHIEAIKLERLRWTGFLRGTARADIRQIDCSFKGDKHQMKSYFCMLYQDLTVKAWEDSSAPYQIVAKNSGFVNFLANLALPGSNPASPGKAPKEVEFDFTRDPMLPYPSYLIQNLTYGMLHTVLPGGSVRKTKK